MRQRFEQQGDDGFHDHELLEMLLSCALPRVNTNPIAHELLQTFGSVTGVLDAPSAELMKVPGMLLRLLPGLCRRYYSEQQNHVILDSSEKCGAYLTPRFIGRRVETVFLVCTDAKCRVLGCQLLHAGSVNSAEVNSRKVVETALRFNAAAAVLAHNHPGGMALPSQEDLSTTQRLQQALAAVGVRLLDHIIVADGDFVSLADSGIL
jgi:DNA repair protein RadC